MFPALCVLYLFIILPIVDSEDVFTNGAHYQGYQNKLCPESTPVLATAFVHLSGEADRPIRNTAAAVHPNKIPDSCDTTTR